MEVLDTKNTGLSQHGENLRTLDIKLSLKEMGLILMGQAVISLEGTDEVYTIRISREELTGV